MAEAALPLDFAAFNQLSARQKMGAMATVALMIALLAGGLLWTREPPYSLLFSGISEKDGGQIITNLQQQNIPYKFAEGGGSILVPASVVHDVRLKLASQGLPRGGQIGFELMENLKLGSTQFAEQIAYQRGLEGELSRTIASLGAVRGARVHLAIPKQTAFLRDEKPSASVLVSLHPGRVLEPAQVAGIVHLVSSSVPQLAPTQVSVIDQDGNLISQQADALRNAGLDPTQIKFIKEIETSYVKRIEAILAPVVGASNVKAQVAADVDFSQIDQVAETYKPNPTPGNTIRSQQTAETGSGNPIASGVPGALSNQPPVPATAPITSPGGAAAGGGGSQNNFSRNATINYEVDKTIRHTRGVPGSVKRLTVAVVVNNKKGPEKDGKPGKSIPLTEAEMKQVNALTRDAVGFSQDRGDSINIANITFAPAEKEIAPDLPLWKNPDVIAIAREAGKYLVFLIVAMLLWNKVFKPIFNMYVAAMKRAEEEREAEKEALRKAHEMESGTLSYDSKLQMAKDLAKQDPKVIAGVIKEWVGSGQS